MKRLFILALLIVSCNGNNKKEEQNPIEDKATPVTSYQDVVKLEFDIETSVPEDMKLISTNIFLNNGQFMDLYITQHISKNETSKTLTFELPKGVKPDYNIGLSFGTKTLKEIKINRATLSFADQNFSIDSKEIMTFFKTNRFVDYNEETGVFKTKKVDGKHNPIIFLRKPYIDKIQGIN